VGTTILTEENRGLIPVNHPQNPIFTQKKFWYAEVKASN